MRTLIVSHSRGIKTFIYTSESSREESALSSGQHSWSGNLEGWGFLEENQGGAERLSSRRKTMSTESSQSCKQSHPGPAPRSERLLPPGRRLGFSQPHPRCLPSSESKAQWKPACRGGIEECRRDKMHPPEFRTDQSRIPVSQEMSHEHWASDSGDLKELCCTSVDLC